MSYCGRMSPITRGKAGSDCYKHGGVELDSVSVKNTVEQAAMRYLEDQAYSALLGYKEPVRSAEIVGAVGKEEYSAKLVRHVLAASPRFAQIDRRWDLEVRYEDKQRPVERVIREIISEYGRPMSVQQIAIELSSVYERPVEYYEGVAARMLADEEKYFRTSDDLFALREWLLRVTSDSEEDLIFDNELSEEEVGALEKAAAKVDWTAGDVAATAVKFVDAAKAPVCNKLIGLFQWRALGEAFDAVATFDKLIKSDKLVWLSDQRWSSKRMVEKYDAMLVKMADRLAEEIIEEAPQAVVERAEEAEEVAPALSLTISERDLDEVAQIVSAEGVARMPAILETIFEISPGEPIYAVAAEGLGDAMRADPRFVWVGAERWRMADTVPAYANVIPPELEIPTLVFETPEGERLDVELEDEGLEGGLDKEIHNPLVQDIGDQDPITEQDELPPSESARCSLTRHHRMLGTFPLCQIPKTFFPLGPHLIEVTLVDGDKRGDVWVNRDTGLIYDMGDWYVEDMPESGVLFHLVRTASPDEFQFAYEGKTDPLVLVNPNRIEELLALAEEARQREMTTFELMCRIMPYHRKGVPFITLFTELNIARRTTRRLVASILSSYYAFYQKPKSALWHFDEKKVDQGFKKAKRKYVRKA